jgi:hypothetical protein
MAAKVKTRKQSARPVFGLPKELSGNKLPTYADVIKFYFWVQNKSQSTSTTKKKETVADIAQIVATRVEEIWTRASIPFVSRNRVLRLFRGYYDKYLKLLKPFKKRQKEDKYKQLLNSFKEEGHSRLFDIASCKCDFDKCRCEKSRKVPIHEQAFLRDQRSARLMFIGHIDQHLSRTISTRYKRKLANVRRVENYTHCGESSRTDDNKSASESDDDIPLAQLQKKIRENQTKETDDESDDTLSPAGLQASSSSTGNLRLKRDLPALARACDRVGVSDRAAAAIASAVLEDFGMISPEDSQNVVDKNKIRRARQRKRRILQEVAVSNDEQLRSLYFDGRKDHTIKNTLKGSKWYRQKAVEEHISLIEEPGSKYIGHVTPKSGSAQDVKNSLLNYLKDRLEFY